MNQMLERWIGSVYRESVFLLVAFLVFSIVERLFYCVRPRKPLRATGVDLAYAFTSFLYPPFLNFVIAAAFGYFSLHPKSWAGHTPLDTLPFIGELLAALFVRDCLIYIRHRIFHARLAWPFHSIHHSSEEVNWLSAARFHPIENIIEATGEIALYMTCAVVGVGPRVIAMASLIVGIYNFMEHSNLRWTFGPLKYVLVSPVYHRWHHSDSPPARDKNFAAMFSCIDLLLGTFYMPENFTPKTTGLNAEDKKDYPRTFLGQLAHPFKKYLHG